MFTHDGLACKNSLYPFDKYRSVRNNKDILEWILIYWKCAMPLEAEKKRDETVFWCELFGKKQSSKERG